MLRNKYLKKLIPVVLGISFGSAVFLTGCSGSEAEKAVENAIDGGGIPTASVNKDTPKAGENASNARNTPVVRAAKEVGPAVVGITNKAVARDWFNNQVQVEQGVGSGVIFRSDGYIVTNYHVIAGAQEIVVSLPDERSFTGQVIGADELTDLAVVKIDATDLKVAEFGNSDDIMVGEPAIAIGNPMGLEFQGSVTSGVISALNRTLDINERQLKLIQTDAAINPGNSGGALVNADGKVIGINSAKLAANGVEGMGFAIPINSVRAIVDELMSNGKVLRPYIGVGVFDKETAARQGYRLNAEKGVYVEEITLNGPADKAGIRRGDLILEIDGKEINKVGELRAVILEHKAGDTIRVKIERDGSKNDVDVVLEAAK